jgi:hypothetical protein
MPANSSRPRSWALTSAWARRRCAPGRARPTGRIHQRVQRAGHRVQADHVAVAHLGQRPAGQRLGADVDGRRHLAAGAAHAAVGDQRHLEALALQHRQRRRELVQFGHAVGVRALEAHHGHHVASSSPALKAASSASWLSKTRAGASITWRSSGTAEVLITARPRLPCSSFRPPVARTAARPGAARCASPLSRGSGCQRRRRRPSRHVRCRPPGRAGRHRGHVGVQAAAVQQLAQHEARAAGGLELVHVGTAVGVDAGQQRHHRPTGRQSRSSRSGCRRRAPPPPSGSGGWCCRRWPAARPSR